MKEKKPKSIETVKQTHLYNTFKNKINNNKTTLKCGFIYNVKIVCMHRYILFFYA